MTISSPILPDRQCDPVVAHCDRCGAEQYREDTLYTWEGTRICGECIKARVDAMTIQEIAALFGSEPVRAGLPLKNEKEIHNETL